MSLRKRVRIGKYAVPILLLLTIAVGTVAAVSYVVLTWTISLTVAPHPRVFFYNSALTAPDDEANTMEIPLNIFPSITTIDEDSPWDIRSEGTGDIYIRVSVMDTTEVTDLKIIAYTGVDHTVIANQLFDEDWTGPDAAGVWRGGFGTTGTEASPVDYNLYIEVTGDEFADADVDITVELKVESP